ncbi:MAG: VacJ family lipoprotein [Rhodobacteraceae bacterium]|nr:VacJ family lipoprotein [Paracoccaceae bacterium]MCY4139146.1 VacJ family lipoprotein [Paracoccaceae bacterium]
MTVFLASIMMVSLTTQCPADRWSDADPFEKSNRQTHEFNKGFDRGFYRPASRAYGTIVPSPIDVFIANFSRNLDLPGRAVNYLLQADLTATALVVGRFATNTIIGFGGIGDPATDLGFPDEQTDFGVTLHTWGVDRGNYLELPFLGPRTVRQATGMVVDVFLDPVSQVLPARYDRAVFTVSFLDLLSRRQRSGDFLDQMLHESEDSYVATRSAYFDNRDRVLNRGLLEDDLEDPYAE